MADPDAIRYLRIAQADLAEARRMVELSGLQVKSEQNPTGDIEIETTGLRPGEKLYEELLIGDNPQPTQHARIMKAQEDSLPWGELQTLLKALDEAMVREAGISLDRALFPLLVLVERVGPIGVVELAEGYGFIGAFTAVNAAIETKIPMPPTLNAIAMTDSLLRLVLLTRELRIAVITSATAPMG